MDPTVEALDLMTARQETKLNNELIKAYQQTLKEVRSQVALMYEKFGGQGVLDYPTMMKYNRLSALEGSIVEQLTKLYAETGKALNKNLTKMFVTNYLYTGYLIETATQAKLGFMMLSDEVIKKSIQNPISGLSLNQRLGKNRNEIILKMKEQLTQGLIQGESIDKMGKRIKGLLEGDTTKALRIAQTETNRVRNEGKEKGYDKAKTMGIRFNKVWMSTLDSRTRDNHRKLDGMYADKDGYFKVGRFKALHPGGFGAAEMDCNCRCTSRAELVGYGPEKRKDNETKKIIDYETYEDWKKERVSN